MLSLTKAVFSWKLSLKWRQEGGPRTCCLPLYHLLVEITLKIRTASGTAVFWGERQSQVYQIVLGQQLCLRVIDELLETSYVSSWKHMIPKKLFCWGYFPHASAGLRGVSPNITSAVMHPFLFELWSCAVGNAISCEPCCQHQLSLVEADEDIFSSPLLSGGCYHRGGVN